MKRFNRLINHPEYHVLLFCLGFILTNWPFLGIIQWKPPEIVFSYFFSLWALAILLLFLITRGYGKASQDGNRKDERNHYD